jgi:O-antigen/teichoic acid export membrane protein/aminoglycoside phosphotransferase
MAANGIAASLATHLREPMRRSAYALIAGTGLTTLLGMVFWLLAARLLPTDAVGTGTALASAMTFLATLSTLGLRNSLVRFLAPAGASARRLIITCYLLCVSAALVSSIVFIVGQPLWADNLGFLRENRFAAFGFVIATMVWVLFVLEDHVLIGLRRAGWVPVTNGIYSGVKIALLPALVSGGAYALLAATVLPAVPIVIVVTVFVLWVTSRRVRAGESVEKLRIAQLVRFALADHSSTILWLATTELLTLVVLQQAGPEASAYYFMSFTIAYALYLVTSNIGSAFVAEAARYPSRAAALAGAALGQAAILVIPLALLAFVLARFGLGLLGPEYAANGTVVLRLLLLSAIPQVVIGISLNAARVRRDNRLILAVYAAQAVGVFGGTVLTIEHLGLTGVGLAWLTTQVMVALVLVLTKRTGAESGTTDLAGVVGLAGWFASRLRQERNRRLARKLVPSALSALGLPMHRTGYRLLTSDGDSLVASIASGTDQSVLKIATTAAASRGLNRHAEMVFMLRERLGQSRMLSLVPLVLQKATVQGYTVLLENRLPGMAYSSRMPESSELEAAALAISDLHRRTRSHTVVDRAILTDWVDTPISQLRRLPALDGQEFALQRLKEELYGALMDQQVTTSYVHGDYWLGNVLLERTDGRVKATGIVDWENARPVGIPDCDLIHLWLTSQPGELGMIVRRALLSPDAVQSAVARLGTSWTNPQLPTGHLVLLVWLWHVTAELQRATRNRVGPLWLARTVKPILNLPSSSGIPSIFNVER